MGPDCGKNQPCQGRPRSSRIRSGRFLKEQDPYPRRIALLPTYPRHRWAGERKQGWESDLSPHALPHFFPHLSLGAPPATPQKLATLSEGPSSLALSPFPGTATLCPPACLHLEKSLSDLSVSLPCLCGGREGRGREREIISAFTQLVVIRRQGPGALLTAAPKATAGPRVAAEWALATLSESSLTSQLLPLGSPLQSPRGMPCSSSSPQLLLPGAISGARPRFSAPSTAGWGYVHQATFWCLWPEGPAPQVTQAQTQRGGVLGRGLLPSRGPTAKVPRTQDRLAQRPLRGWATESRLQALGQVTIPLPFA